MPVGIAVGLPVCVSKYFIKVILRVKYFNPLFHNVENWPDIL